MYISRVIDLLDPSLNTFTNLSVDDARGRVLSGDAASVRAIDGSFALVASEGITVRMARSMDRPLRYFLAKRHEGPALYVADRIDTLHRALAADGLDAQFHPSYTRIALADETAKWLTWIDGRDPHAPLGVAFSGGVDSGSVFLVVYHTMLRLGMSPQRLKAFVLNVGDGPDVDQARRFLASTGLSMFLEEISGAPEELDACETIKVLEDYKPLDVECASMGLRLLRGIRERYADWRYIADGDGGDENLKDYPIEENSELTIRSVVDNLMLYQEG